MQRNLARPATILYVEDDPDDFRLTQRALEDDQVRVDLKHVQDGEEALDYLLGRGQYAGKGVSPPDIVFLDLNLPRMDGREVLEEMRRTDSLRHIPVVVLTTSDQEADIVRMYKIGCNSFVTKPVDTAKFINTIRELRHYWLQLVSIPPQ